MKDRDEGLESSTKEEKGIHEFKGLRKHEIAQEKRDQQREAMDKYLTLLQSKFAKISILTLSPV